MIVTRIPYMELRRIKDGQKHDEFLEVPAIALDKYDSPRSLEREFNRIKVKSESPNKDKLQALLRMPRIVGFGRKTMGNERYLVRNPNLSELAYEDPKDTIITPTIEEDSVLGLKAAALYIDRSPRDVISMVDSGKLKRFTTPILHSGAKRYEFAPMVFLLSELNQFK